MQNKVYRAVFQLSWLIFCRFTPVQLNFWRVFILKIFGAQVDYSVKIYPSVVIRNPFLLTMRKNSCLGPHVIVYNVTSVTIGEKAVVSQRAHLCAASHDIDRPDFDLVFAPIYIGRYSWVAAESFIGPGVELGEFSVVYARGVVTKSVESHAVVGGNPARLIRYRQHK